MASRPPIGEAEGKREQVEAMFDAIAPRYDLLNRVLSAGIDQSWRRKAVRCLEEHQPRRILDVATGTADMAIEAAEHLGPERVVGIDLSEAMLEKGRQKIARCGFEELIVLRKGDAQKLPFSDNQFDAALVGFGVRNFENRQEGLRDIHRVLRPGGTLVILEFSQPKRFLIKQLYRFYSRHILPRIGRFVSQDEGAYEYLPKSAAAFPSGEDFLRELHTAGYHRTSSTPLTFGIASIYQGSKPAA